MIETTRITHGHLDRCAYVWVRQPSPAQIQHHGDATERQHRLAERALALGWAPEQVKIVDGRLGAYGVGAALGAQWARQTIPVSLTGNLAKLEARALIVAAKVAGFPSVRLAFAWTRAAGVPLILGQANFFKEFDVFFSRSLSFFEVSPAPR